ncbi:MAG: DUF4236 domain-containing protein [bacterium]
MGLRFRKSFGFGGLRTNLSTKGVGTSFGFFGFRFGVTAEGKKYWSFGIRGTGLYYIKYY